MKRTLIFTLVLAIMLGMSACISDGDVATSESESDNLTATQSTILDYTETMNLFGYEIKYDNENASMGFENEYFYGDDYLIFGIEAYENAADSWEETFENCKASIFESLSGVAEFGIPETTEQTIVAQEEMVLNGIDWLKVTGTFKNTREGEEYERDYVAYYAMTEAELPEGGTGYIPFYVVGMPQVAPSSETLEAFVDEFVSQITRNDQ